MLADMVVARWYVMYVLWLLLKITLIGEMRWTIALSDWRSRAQCHLLFSWSGWGCGTCLPSLLISPGMWRKLCFFSASIRKTIFALIPTHSGHCWGRFLPHYRDNLADKRNRDFANATSHTSMLRWPDYGCWPNYRGLGGCNYRPGHNSDAGSRFSMPSSTVETNQNSVCSRRFSTKHVGFSPGNFFKWIPFCLL